MFDVILCGAGRMGLHHLRVVREHPAFRMVAIVDPAFAGGAIDNVPVVATPHEVPASVRAAIVATPTATHLAVALELIDRGLHLLVEKPLAPTVHACEQIARAAGRRDVRVAIGHVERFNPAVRALAAALPTVGPIRRLSLVRGGGGRYCDVLLELAVHDLDLLERFAGRASLRASHLNGEETVTAADLELVTEIGAVATIRVDCGPPPRTRTVVVEGELGTLRADLLAMTCASCVVPADEPLRAQLDAFAAFLRGEPSAICRIDEATRSVELATAARIGAVRVGRVEGMR